MKWGVKFWKGAGKSSEAPPPHPPPLRAAGEEEEEERRPPPSSAPLRAPRMDESSPPHQPPLRAAGGVSGVETNWNLTFIPAELHFAILDILNRDFCHIWDDPTEKLRDRHYPIIIDPKTDELCWKRDEFVMDAFVYKYMDVNWEKLATDLDKQWFRRMAYKRIGYSLKKYCEIFCK